MIPSDVGYTVAVWVEITLYAIYTYLFCHSVYLTVNKRSSRLRKGDPSWVFLIVTLLMYIVATFHIFIALYRYLRAFILGVDPLGYQSYMNDLQRWDKEANSVSIATMAWLSDCLMTYRCYLVWNSNIWIIVIPIILQSCSLGVNIVVLVWFRDQSIVSPTVAQKLLDSIYPFSFIRTVTITALIVLKIWKQHQSSSGSGVVDRGSRLGLGRIVRIVIESAMFYALQLLVLIILFVLNSDFLVILQPACVPSVGLVFVLITVRAQTAKTQPTSTLPGWLDASSNSRNYQDEEASSPDNGVTSTVNAVKLEEVDKSETSSESSAKGRRERHEKDSM